MIRIFETSNDTNLMYTGALYVVLVSKATLGITNSNRLRIVDMKEEISHFS